MFRRDIDADDQDGCCGMSLAAGLLVGGLQGVRGILKGEIVGKDNNGLKAQVSTNNIVLKEAQCGRKEVYNVLLEDEKR